MTYIHQLNTQIMKIKSTLVVLGVCFIWLTSVSNRLGRANLTGGGSTTAPGETGQYCGAFGCHFSDAFDVEAKLQLLSLDSMPVSVYTPGEEYIISVDADRTGFPTAYGFQIVGLSSQDDSGLAGFHDFPERVREVMINDRQYVEQSNRIPQIPIYLNWTAPEEGTGTVDFYAVVNAVDGNGTSNGDGADSTRLQIPEDIMSSNEALSLDYNVSIFPNPASDNLVVQADKAFNRAEIINVSGQKVMDLNTGNQQIDISSLKPGIYILNIIFEDKTRLSEKLLIN